MTAQKITLLFVTTALYATFVCLQPVSAQSIRNVTVVPPSTDYTVNPGDKISGTLKVVNDSDAPITFRADIRDFIVQDTNGTPTILPPGTLNDRFSAASWIGITPNSFTILPRQKQIIDFYIQVPKNASPGGHYMSVIYTPIDSDVSSTTGASVQTQSGTLFRLTVSGTINEYALLTKLHAPGFQENGPVVIGAQVQNEGDLHIKPSGSLKVVDMFGRTIEEQQLPQYNVFPTSARNYSLKVGSYWMIGRYEAHILANYGSHNNLPLSAKVVFWVFPWRVAIVITLAIIAVVLSTLLFLRKKKHGQQLPESL